MTMPFSFYLFTLLAGAGALWSLRDWRVAPYCMILIAALQDPIRKVTPGAPAWFLLSIVPIFLAMAVGLARERPAWLWSFAVREPRIFRAALWFGVWMVVPLLLSVALYGLGGLKLAMLGFLSYGVALCAIVIGFHFGMNAARLRQACIWFVVVTAVMLIGLPLDYAGAYPDWLALGTEAMGMEWVRYSGETSIELFAGFYRSPDIMGWHSTMAAMVAILLALTTKNPKLRVFWLMVAAWALVGTFLCGRRKFFYMLPIFLLALVWLKRARWRSFLPRLGIAVGLAAALFAVMYQQVGVHRGVDAYYFSTADEAFGRAEQHAFDSVIMTFRQSGILGRGLGSAATGAHHLPGTHTGAWQEGGLDRLAVELGLPGLLLALWFGWTLLRRLNRISSRLAGMPGAGADLYGGICAIVAANAASFVVSGQIFGDPFVGFFLALLVGAALGGGEVIGVEESVEPSPSDLEVRS